ncbi:MFS general substrate transporter [Thozetella sp. PMI_491]|nr:MFS general substrate transporter [Thozetella sp. PMI_491]
MSSAQSTEDKESPLHFAQRGKDLNDSDASNDIVGFDTERMRARSALTSQEERKLLRKIDLRIMTLCSILFLFKNMDANNLSNARIMNSGTPRNIMAQLSMTSEEYNLLTVLYYSRIMISWGIALLCHVPVSNKSGIYATRFLLGLCEAGMFPGVILQMTYWYRPDEMSVRLLYFCEPTWTLIPILASLTGAATVIFGFIVYFFLPDFPPTAKWLTEKEKAFIQARLPPNAPRAAELNFNFREIIADLKDIRLWMFTLIWATFTVGTTGVTFYQPTVIANLGFTTIARAQLLNLPITILSLVIIGVTGIFADSGRLPRPLYPLMMHAVVIACYGVMVAYPSNAAVYAATLIGNAFTAAFFPLMWPWRVQTTARATGSAFSIGFVNSYGQIGGAVGPQIFLSKYAPRYQQSFGAAMACVGACALVTLATWWVTRKTESDTRRLKRARVQAGRRGLAVLEDVVDRDLGAKGASDSESA